MSVGCTALLRRADEVAALSRRLDKLSRMLRHTAHCPAEDHFACPTFRRMLVSATNATKANPQPHRPERKS